MIWAIRMYKEEDELGFRRVKEVTLLDDNTLETRVVPREAIIKGLQMGMRIANIYVDKGEILQCAIEQTRGTKNETHFNNIERSLKKFALRPYRNNSAICFDIINNKLICCPIKDTDGEMRTYFSICPPSESALVLEYEQQLNTGIARNIMLKQDIIGGDFNVVKDGDDVILVGGLNGPLDGYERDVVIPKGITTIAGGAISYVKSITFPDTVRKFLPGSSLMCSYIHNIPTEVEWNKKNCSIYGCLGNTNEETPIVVPKVNNWEPTKGYLSKIQNKKIIYNEVEENKIYKDCLFYGNNEVEAIALMGKGRIGIGESQFCYMYNLKSILTPNGKIVAIDKEGLSNCPALASIDLSECQYIGDYGLRGIYSDGAEKFRTLTLCFKKNIKLGRGSLDGNVRKVVFECDDIELEGRVFTDEGDVDLMYRTEKVKEKLKAYIYNYGDWQRDGRIRMYRL